MSRVLKDATNQITQGYSSSHKAVDLVKYKNKTCYIIAHTEGKVVWVQTGQGHNPGSTGNKSYGNAVKIQHPNGYYTLYAHMKDVKVKLNQYVSTGQVIGYMSDSGNAKGAHLHLELRLPDNTRINPTPYLDSDLPNMGTITYQVYDCKKKYFLPNVKVNTNDYAGNKGDPVGAIYIDKLEYRTRDVGRTTYSPWVKGRNDYAGNKKPIDRFQCKGCKAYRVSIKGRLGWLSWVYKVDDTPNGYAGIDGKQIDRVQIQI